MGNKEELWPPLFEAARQVGTRITLRLEETVSYGPKLVDRIDALALRLTAGDVRNLLAGAKWPEFLKAHFPDLVEIELDDDLLGRLDEIAPLFPDSTVLSAVVRIEKETWVPISGRHRSCRKNWNPLFLLSSISFASPQITIRKRGIILPRTEFLLFTAFSWSRNRGTGFPSSEQAASALPRMHRKRSSGELME